MRMTAEEFDRERQDQNEMHLRRELLEEGLNSEEEYCQFDTRNLEKWGPKTGSVLSGKFLIYAENRANMSHGKEACAYEKDHKD